MTLFRWRRRQKLSIVVLRFALGFALIYIYCDYLIYYVTQVQCEWPALGSNSDGIVPLHVMVLADTHLIGAGNFHWFDKWHEWQLQQCFRTAMFLHKPEVVFILGDIFDKGEWCSEKEFSDYVERFHKMFKVPDGTAMYTLVGNHDIGFHYRITPQLVKRFEGKMESHPVERVSIRGNHFVLINSMAMEGDGCALCARAVKEIDRISDVLKCSSGSPLCKSNTRLEQYSRPIILQHFPLYRESDSLCTDSDAAPLPQRNNVFEERWDCLSKESTEYLVESLQPRAVFGGHTHHSCIIRHSFVPTNDHKIEFVEYTVPSFSWKKRVDPMYYLLSITPEELKVAKCGIHREWTTYITAIVMSLALLTYLAWYSRTATTFSYKYLSNKKM